MADRFVPLTAFLRGHVEALADLPIAAQPVDVASAPDARSETSGDDYAHAAVLGELTLMRLAACEAFERAASALLATFGADVLGRELALAPVDVEALARAAIACCRQLEPVRIVLSAHDAEHVRTTLPMRVDPSLSPGDLVLEVRDGALESPLSFRVAGALERATAEAR